MTTIAFDKLSVEDKAVLAQSYGMLPIFEDPISFEIMDKAMMTPCGHSFSESSITGWLHTNTHCPLCNKSLKKSDILPNYALRTAIARFVTAQKHLQQNVQSATINVGVSSEGWASQQLNLEDWKVIRVEHNDFEGELTTDSKLLVELIGARDLKTDWFGYVNPYCVVEFCDQKKKSKVVHRNASPKWEEVLVFNIANTHSEESVILTLWDRDRILKDRFLGMVIIPLPEVVASVKMVRRFPLQKKTPTSRRSVRGDVLLRVQFLDLRKSYEVGKTSTSTPPSPAPSIRHTFNPPPSPQSPLSATSIISEHVQPEVPNLPEQQELLEPQNVPFELPEPHSQEDYLGPVEQQHSMNESSIPPPRPPPLPPRRSSLVLSTGPSASAHTTEQASSHRISSQDESIDTILHDNDHDGADINSDHESIESASDVHYHDSSNDDSEHQRQLWEAMGVLDMQLGDSVQEIEDALDKHLRSESVADNGEIINMHEETAAVPVCNEILLSFNSDDEDGEVEELLHQRRNRRSNNTTTITTTTTTTTTTTNNNNNNNTNKTNSKNKNNTNNNYNDNDNNDNNNVNNDNTNDNNNDYNNDYNSSNNDDYVPHGMPDSLKPTEFAAPPTDLVLQSTSHITSSRPAYLNVEVHEDDIKALVEMGFPEPLASFALKFCENDVDVALDRLLNHTDEVQLDFLKSLFFSN